MAKAVQEIPRVRPYIILRELLLNIVLAVTAAAGFGCGLAFGISLIGGGL